MHCLQAMNFRRNSAAGAAPAAMPFGPPPPPMAFSPLYRQPSPYYSPYPAQSTSFLPPHVYLPQPPINATTYNFAQAPAAPAPPPHVNVPQPAMHAAAAPAPPLWLRTMTAANLDSEMGLIGEMMVQYPYVTIDVEFAGVVHHPPYTGSRPTPDEIYAAVKSNVDEVPAVQIGITLSDAEGNLPTRSSSSPEQEIAWEVVFSDFDAGRDPHVVDSVEFLKSQGIDFDLARQIGVTSTAFGEKLLAILPPPSRRGELTWSAFGGAYDMGYLVKMLTGGQPLPETRQQLMQLVKSRLGGGRIFDSKYLVEHDRQDLRNAGLRHTADVLGVRQQEGVKMLAGHKSVVAAAIFATIRSQGVHLLHEGVIDGIL